MSDAYRDPLAGLRAQIEVKRTVAEELYAELGLLRRRLLPPETVAVLDALAREVRTVADTVEGLTRIDAKAEAWQDALRTALEMTDEMTDGLEYPTRREEPAPKSGTPIAGLDALKGLLETTTQTTAETWGSEGFACMFEDRGVRYVLVADGFPTMRRGFLELAHVALGLRISMRNLPAIVVAPIAYVATYRAKVSFPDRKKPNRPAPTAFEDRFELRGDVELAAAILDDETKRALLDLETACVAEPPAQRRFPAIETGDGYAEVAWTCLLEPPEVDLFLDRGIDVLRGFRRALGSRSADRG